jgi:hypothetical protein
VDSRVWSNEYDSQFKWISQRLTVCLVCCRNQQVKKQGRTESATWLVLWYGSDVYSLLQPKTFIPYEDAKKRGTHELAKAIKSKMINGKKLSKDEESARQGFEDMEEDLSMNPTERKRGVLDFKETYEMLTMNDVEELDWELERDDDSSIETVLDEGIEADESAHVGEIFDVVDETNLDQANSKGKVTKSGKEEAKPESTIARKDTTIEAVKDVASDFGDEDDADAAEKDRASDETYYSERNSKEGSTKKKKNARPKLKTAQNDELTKRKKQIKPADLTKREKKAFRDCEARYCPLLEKWREVLSSRNPTKLNSILKTKVLIEVEDFSPTFIETYNVSGLVKQSKILLKEMNEDLDIYNKVREAFKSTYEEKKKGIPKDLKIPKSSAKRKQESKDSVKPGDPDAEADRYVKPTSSPIRVKTEGQLLTEVAIPRRETSGSSHTSALVAGTANSTKPNALPTVERLTFRLVDLMGQGPKDVAQGSASESIPRAPTNAPHVTPSSASNVTPSWMIECTSDLLRHDQRMLALEFLLEMASTFPIDVLNPDALARSLEFAIFESATGRKDIGEEAWLNPYWKKIHTIVACVSGKLKPGSLFQRVLGGYFKNAVDLVNLSKEELDTAFEAND